ncbi:MAG: hypothetical protein Q9159_002164 [Coniocarpon cinnabarinum]
MNLALDLGCGTGVCTRAIAKRLPSGNTVGVDIAPPSHESSDGSPNSKYSFVKANVEDQWEFVKEPSTVDYILSRMLTTAIRDWQSLYLRAFVALRPGGYFESQETSIELLSDDSISTTDRPLMKWFNYLGELAIKNGVERYSIDLHGERLRQAGFHVITERPIKFYLDETRPEMAGRELVSRLFFQQINDFLDTMTPKLFRNTASVSLEEGRQLASEAREDLRQNSGKFGYHTR